MKNKNFNFLEWNNGIFISSIKKIDANILWIIILDALFYFLSGYLTIFWLQRIQAKMSGMLIPSPEALASLGYEKAQEVLGEAKAFYYLLIFSIVLLLIAIIFIASILKGVIWAKTTKTKISFGLISKFLGLNLIWMGIWFLVFFMIAMFMEPASAPLFMVIAITLSLYFTNTLYTIFMKTQRLKSIIEAVKLNITKIHLLLLPYAAIFALLYVMSRLFGLVKFPYSQTIFGLVLVAYAAFLRYYVSELAAEVQKL